MSDNFLWKSCIFRILIVYSKCIRCFESIGSINGVERHLGLWKQFFMNGQWIYSSFELFQFGKRLVSHSHFLDGWILISKKQQDSVLSGENERDTFFSRKQWSCQRNRYNRFCSYFLCSNKLFFRIVIFVGLLLCCASIFADIFLACVKSEMEITLAKMLNKFGTMIARTYLLKFCRPRCFLSLFLQFCGQFIDFSIFAGRNLVVNKMGTMIMRLRDKKIISACLLAAVLETNSQFSGFACSIGWSSLWSAHLFHPSYWDKWAVCLVPW